jgi:hypothetical protein
MSDEELVTVRTFPGRIEAEMAQGVLEGAGIESIVLADDAGGQYANVWLTGVRLLVHVEDAERAKEVLGQS